jgi:hypothetical protein
LPHTAAEAGELHALPQGEKGRSRRPPAAASGSIFDGEAFPDFIDAFVERIEARVNGPVVKVENIPPGEKSENPVMGFHVDEYLLNRVTDGNNNVPHDIPHFEKRDFRFLDTGFPGMPSLSRSSGGV